MSPANPGHSTTTTGGLVPATSYSNVTMSITAAGRPGSALVGTSSTERSFHSPTSDGATLRTRVTSFAAGTSSIGHQALESARVPKKKE